MKHTHFFLILLACYQLTGQAVADEVPCPASVHSSPIVALWGDRTRPFRTKLPVNQPYLDQIAAPPAAAILTAAFEQLAQLQREGKLPPWRVAHAPWRCLLQDGEVGDVRTCGERMITASSPLATLSPSKGAPLPRTVRLRLRPERGSTARASGTSAPTRTEDLVARWRRAEEDAIYADNHRSARYFLSITRPSTALSSTSLRVCDRACGDYPDWFRQLALLAAAHWRHRVGLDDGPDGAEALFAMLAERSAWLKHPAQLGLADLSFGRGQYDEARQQYQSIVTACRLEAGAPRDWCAYRIAQCDEFTGQLAEAMAGYGACAKGEDKDLAAEAGYAVKRVGMLNGGLTPRDPEPVEGHPSPSHTAFPSTALRVCDGRGEQGNGAVRYLGEDRATQGDWYLRYGHEAFILCAQQSPQDVAGGALSEWQVIPSVGNPKEIVRHWVTSRSDNHRSLLWNPLSKVRRAANWDDRGEAYPIGAGPDLLLDVPVPEGEHVISLYFVNDRSYYEPGRVYTISVFDEAGQYLTGAEARYFVRGVYYRFAVAGVGTRPPTRVKFRLWRNLAYNLIFGAIFLDQPGAPPPWPEQVPLWAPHRTKVTLPK